MNKEQVLKKFEAAMKELFEAYNSNQNMNRMRTGNNQTRRCAKAMASFEKCKAELLAIDPESEHKDITIADAIS
jgi:hypothetical protein